MNRARLPRPNEVHDDHRPSLEYWGPVQLRDADGQLRDAVELACLPAHLERPIACPICDSKHLESFGIIYGYPLYHCLECDVGFIWPQPTDELLKRYYGPDYWSNYMNDARTLYERQPLCDQIFRRQAQCFDRLMKQRHDARILDVGAGDGTMIKLLQDLGYRDVSGIDLDGDNCQRARERLNVNVEQADFLDLSEAGWDAISLWAVIEHLKSPRQYVEQAYRLLKPGGMFILMTGDNASASAWLQRCFDMWLYPPEHLFYFGKLSLWHLLKSNGFTNVFTRVGYQAWIKERALSMKRIGDSVNRMIRSGTRPSWRSTASNLLVAWGYKPE